MKILDYEVEFDFNDANDMEKLENAIEKTQKELTNMDEKSKKTSQILREGCNIIFNCFDMIFGENTHKQIFKDKVNLTLCMKAFKDLLEEKENQSKLFDNELKTIEKKYSSKRIIR